MAQFIVVSSIGEGTDFNKDVCMFCSDFFNEKRPPVTSAITNAQCSSDWIDITPVQSWY